MTTRDASLRKDVMDGLHERTAPGLRRFGSLLRRLKGWLDSGLPGLSGWDTDTLASDEGSRSHGPCVLVVDDDTLNQTLTFEMLSLLDVKALLASDGAEAVALAGELRLDLILMDLQMPVLGGLDATRQIRRLERSLGRERVPIVAYTSTPPHEASLGVLGFDGILAKPCDMDALQDCLLQWCPPASGKTSAGHRGPRQHAGWRTDESRRPP